jgi:hypothetical protein
LVACLASTVAAIGEARALDFRPEPYRPSDFQAGVIVGKGPAYLSCDPKDDSCKPEGHPFVSSGTSVAIYQVTDGHLCVGAAPVKIRHWGWLPADRVKLLPNGGARPLGWWAASWRAPDRRIDIWIDKGELKSEAGALWRGPLSARFGEFSGPMKMLPNGLQYTDGCEVTLMGVDQQVVAIDNGQCGALNVSFSGFYKRYRLGEK